MKRHVHMGHVKWIVSAISWDNLIARSRIGYMRSCYHIIPEKNDLCCFGCV